MKRQIVETKKFNKLVNGLLIKRRLLQADLDSFKKKLVEKPELGDIVVGAGGLRKARLKSAAGGKSGGFRICYYYLMGDELIYLLLIYAKNEQEDLTVEDRKMLKNLVNLLKGKV
jgi:hypothetical protein